MRGWKISGELLKDARVGTSKSVDRLIRVADHAEVAVARYELFQQRVLTGVDVLELIDRNERPASLELGGELRMFGQQSDWSSNQVVKIEPILRPHQALVDGEFVRIAEWSVAEREDHGRAQSLKRQRL